MSTQLWQVIGLTVVALFLALILFNGILMLFSPAAWFRLPSHLAFRGTLRGKAYLTTATGRLQIRILGLIFAGIAIGMIFEIWDIPTATVFENLNLPKLNASAMIGAVVSLSVAWSGIQMLLNPKSWYERFLAQELPKEPRQHQTVIETALRIMAVPCILIALYVAWRFI